jgi:MFS family permease
MREGLAYVRATPVITLTVSVIFFVAIFGLNYSVWIPLLAKNEFAVGADGFGVLMAALGIGSLTGALGLAFSGREPKPRFILGTTAALGVAHVVLGVSAWLSLPIALAFVILPLMGFVMSITTASANTIVQIVAPGQMRGRVMSVYMAVLAGTGPVGAIVSGAIADRWGTPASVVVCGAVTTLAAGGVAYAFGAWRADAPAVRLVSTARPEFSGATVPSGSRD